MQTFNVSLTITTDKGAALKVVTFDAKTTEQAIVVARIIALQHGAESYTLVATGDFKWLAA